MTTQQPEALRLANILRGIDARSLFANEKLSAASAALENQHARITELESQLAQRFDAADMATASAQGFRDGATAQEQPVAEQGVAYAALPTSNYAGRVYEEGFLIGTCPLYTADQLRAFADATYALRAAHGQAPAPEDSVQEDALSDSVRTPLDSLHADAAYLIGRLRDGSMPYVRVIEIIRERIDAAKAAIRASAAHVQAPAGATKPTEQQILEAAEKAGLWPNTVRSWIPAFHRYHKELAKAQSAPARADSVLEDAARYQLLRRGQHWSVIDGGGNELLNEALDHEVDAARKQGATP